jgi:hypothetical protein
MMNSAPAVVGASDGLAAFVSIIAKRGPALGFGAEFWAACDVNVNSEALESSTPRRALWSRKYHCVAPDSEAQPARVS